MLHLSELRQDPVTGDWVVVATGRARRPNEFTKHRPSPLRQSKASCPFERLLPGSFLVYDESGRAHRPSAKNRSMLAKRWWLQVIPNKYPAFAPGRAARPRPLGPFHWQDGVGSHEIFVTRDHIRSPARMRQSEVESIVRSYRERYRSLERRAGVAYVSIFYNHGREAGASVAHPHSQLIAIPVIPPDVMRSLTGSWAYYRRHGRCVHCAILAFERRQGWRVIHENRDCIVIAPYVSRSAFEIRIFPIRHEPNFGHITPPEIASVADALRVALAKLSRGLANPDFNFFIHTAPAKAKKLGRHYHWHIEIIPKTAVWAGFEIGTGIEISTISPEAAAAFLRKINIP